MRQTVAVGVIKAVDKATAWKDPAVAAKEVKDQAKDAKKAAAPKKK